ncbi:MAG: 1,4-dihydroxy-2-naphthoate octaprenyltransferase [Actinobacteria bacterium]|nr:MAG: 1,4-dihydroxy-2-naphthoate octaprenyltransferase [Actinomycetota bacterium]
MKASRAPFLVAAAIPAILGGMVAYATLPPGRFLWLVFVLAIVANMTAQVAANLANDYYDHLSTDDDINIHVTPFSGGSRMIQDKLIPARTILVAALIAFAIAFAAGVYLAVTRTLLVLPIGLTGLFIGYFYTAPPIKFAYRGLGELVIGLTFGPLSVAGAYVVQTLSLSGLAWLWPSIPVGLLVLGILYINEFPDYEADRATQKNHLVVRLGLERASKGYVLLLALIYLSIVGPVALGLMPALALISLLGLPLAFKAGSVALKEYGNPETIVPAQATHILLFTVTGLLISLAYLLQALLS